MLKKVYFTLRDRPEDLDGLTGGVFVSGDKLFLEFLPETRCFLAFFGKGAVGQNNWNWALVF